VSATAPPCRRRETAQAQTKTPTRVHVAAKGCHRCYNTPGSLRCCSSPQSKKRFLAVVIIVASSLFHHFRRQFTSPAASPPPSNLSSAATFTTTNTTHLSLSLFYTVLYAIAIACALFKDSPLSLPPPPSFTLHSLLQPHQSNPSHIRNYG
jgi:hypothetical protein